jgi:hypothetical protein
MQVARGQERPLTLEHLPWHFCCVRAWRTGGADALVFLPIYLRRMDFLIYKAEPGGRRYLLSPHCSMMLKSEDPRVQLQQKDCEDMHA